MKSVRFLSYDRQGLRVEEDKFRELWKQELEGRVRAEEAQKQMEKALKQMEKALKQERKGRVRAEGSLKQESSGRVRAEGALKQERGARVRAEEAQKQMEKALKQDRSARERAEQGVDALLKPHLEGLKPARRKAITKQLKFDANKPFKKQLTEKFLYDQEGVLEALNPSEGLLRQVIAQVSGMIDKKALGGLSMAAFFMIMYEKEPQLVEKIISPEAAKKLKESINKIYDGPAFILFKEIYDQMRKRYDQYKEGHDINTNDDASEVKSKASEVKSKASEVKSKASEVKSKASEVKSKASEVKSKAARADVASVQQAEEELRNQVGEVRQDEAAVKNKGSEGILTRIGRWFMGGNAENVQVKNVKLDHRASDVLQPRSEPSEPTKPSSPVQGKVLDFEDDHSHRGPSGPR